MKIGIVCYPTFGGSGVLATELGKALAQKGHEVHFVTYQQPVRLERFVPNIFYHEVQVPTYPLFDFPPYETALASTLVDVIKNHHLDLLHVHYAIPHASAAYLAKQILAKEGIEIPFITTLHGTDITLVGRDKTYAPVVTFSINESDAITAVSHNLREETYRHFKIEKEIENFGSALPAQSPITPAAPVAPATPVAAPVAETPQPAQAPVAPAPSAPQVGEKVLNPITDTSKPDIMALYQQEMAKENSPQSAPVAPVAQDNQAFDPHNISL